MSAKFEKNFQFKFYYVGGLQQSFLASEHLGTLQYTKTVFTPKYSLYQII